MDFGDYLFILIPIGLSIVSAINKKRKAKKKSVPASGARGIFEELFNDNTTVADSVPDSDYDDEMESDVSEYEDEPSEIVAPQNDMRNKLDSLYDFKSKEKKKEPIEDKTILPISVECHSILEDLKSRDEIQKAVIYSEIFERKF